MRISVAFTTLFAALSVLALPLAKRNSEPSLSLRSDVPSSEALFYVRAHTEAHKAAKAAKAVTHKAAGLATQKSKSSDQVKSDRKTRKDQQAVKKAAKADKAKAKPDYKSHEQKIKDKSKITFSPGASRRLDGMGLHGKDRQAAKKYHKNIMKNEMKKNGAAKGNIVATAHTGGTVKHEKNHITAQFSDAKGRPLPSTWTDSKTGETKVGEKNQHHVYVNDKAKTPSAWTKAVDASNSRKSAAEASKKAESDKEFADKAAAAKKAGESTKNSISPEDKKAQREAKKAQKAAKKKPGAS